MNGLLVFGIAVDAGVVALLGLSGEAPWILTVILGVFWVISVVGVVLIAAGVRRPGAYVVLVGCLVFAPIGLIGALGARKVLDAVAQEAFEARRAKRRS